MRRVGAAWERFWFAPQPTSSLALLRIAIGVVCIGWTLSLLPDLHAFFSSSGVEPRPPYHPPFGFWGVLNTFPNFDVAVALYVALLVAACCLTVGYRTRLSSIVVFVAVLSFEHRAPSIWNSGDNLLCIVLFFLMFAPAGASFSVDRWRSARSQFWEFPDRAPWALRLVEIQVSIVYLASVWFKLHGTTWLHGTAVSYTARLEDFQRFALPFGLSHSLLFSSVVTYWTIAIELMIGILVWNRAARPYVLALGVGLHVLAGLNMRLGFFSETMIAAYLAFLSPAAASSVIVFVRDWLRRVGVRGIASRRLTSRPSEHIYAPAAVYTATHGEASRGHRRRRAERSSGAARNRDDQGDRQSGASARGPSAV